MACCNSFFHDGLKRLPLEQWRALTHRLPYITTQHGDRYDDEGRTFEMRNCACGGTISRELTASELATLDRTAEVRS